MSKATTVAFDPALGYAVPLSSELDAVNVVAASGAAQTIPEPAVAALSRITLTAACTLTFPAAAAGKVLLIELVQDGTGSRLVTWPASVKWAAATAPTLSTGAGKVDRVQFACTDGTTWAPVAAPILDLR